MEKQLGYNLERAVHKPAQIPVRRWPIETFTDSRIIILNSSVWHLTLLVKPSYTDIWVYMQLYTVLQLAYNQLCYIYETDLIV